jgi:hypothetical protein
MCVKKQMNPMWWCTPVIPTLPPAEAGGLSIQGQPELSYIMRTCLENKNKNKANN